MTVRHTPPPGLSPGDPVRLQMRKWDLAAHWGADVLWLGEDEHGWWAGWPEGTPWSRPGADFISFGAQVGLFPRERGFAATFYERAPGSGYEFRLYADVTTAPGWDGAELTCVDLDLDVIQRFDGGVFVDDEDEFAEHRVRHAYPDEVVEHATVACDRVRRAVELSQPPFDPDTASRWLSLVDEAMMAG